MTRSVASSGRGSEVWLICVQSWDMSGSVQSPGMACLAPQAAAGNAASNPP